ncbi:MAG: hypothetical protein ABGX16_19745 [Pirellulales bacterium]
MPIGRWSNPIARMPGHDNGLGKLDEAGRLGVEQAARDTGLACTNGSRTARDPQQLSLFDQVDDTPIQPEWVEVDASGVRVENCRQFGGPWLALEEAGDPS